MGKDTRSKLCGKWVARFRSRERSKSATRSDRATVTMSERQWLALQEIAWSGKRNRQENANAPR